MPRRPPLTVAQILAWADWYHERAGRWPLSTSGRVLCARGETWVALDMALREGYRCLPGDDSLARLLARERGVRNVGNLSPLTEEQIIQWAKAHYRRAGRWPHENDGAVHGAPGEKWGNLNQALRDGRRGLPGGSSLGRMLAQRLGLRNRSNIPRLSVSRILTWADAHHARTGAWPKAGSGLVFDAPGEDWRWISEALRRGRRGLKAGSSLAILLLKERSVHSRFCPPRLSQAAILRWADAHHARTGFWPNAHSGLVVGARGETWSVIDQALRHGRRGMPGGDSLYRLLCRRRRIMRNRSKQSETTQASA